MNKTNNYLEDYYQNYCDEDHRLLTKHGKIEYLTTMKYIHKYISKGHILELGAGTGRYSLSLAREGYTVDALELIKYNIDIFKQKLQPNDQITINQGNAMDLSIYQDNTFDATLVLGPMYHLYTIKDKMKVLEEVKRVTKKDGYIFIAYCMNEATIIQWGFNNTGENIINALHNKILTNDYHCISDEKELFELVRIEDIDYLNMKMQLKRKEIISTDLFTHYIKQTIDEMTEEVFNIYLDYHFKVCMRADLIGVSNHTLDIVINNK